MRHILAAMSGLYRKKEPRPTNSKVAVAASTYPHPTLTPIKLVVDHDRSLKAAIKAGNYDEVDKFISDKNFPPLKKGVEEVEGAIVYFDVGDRKMLDGEIDAALERLGLRDGDLRELLTLGEKHPELHRLEPIARGESCRGYGAVPYFCKVFGRDVSMASFGRSWGGGHFLAFYK